MPIMNVGKIEIYYDTFGNQDHPPVLLIMGAGSQGMLWSNQFCGMLASQKFYVIRYDHRDTGLSSSINFDKTPYNLSDLTSDAVQLLDTLGIHKAHVIGLSMGGYIAQLLEIHYPERLISAAIIMSTPDHMVVVNALMGKTDYISNLPKPTEAVLKFHSQPDIDLTNKDGMIAHQLQNWRLLNGDKKTFDEQYWLDLLTKLYDREKSHFSAYNHGKACIASTEDRTLELRNTHTPTLVIHGSADPMLPWQHGKALADSIPDSTFLLIENMGHVLNPAFDEVIISSITNHFNRYKHQSQFRK